MDKLRIIDMIHTIKVNINEVIEFASDEEKEALFRSLIFDRMNALSRVKSIKWLLNDLLDCELEFDKRDALIKAYKLIINNIE